MPISQHPFKGFFTLATSDFSCPPDSFLWWEWRLTYEGGPRFREEYLEEYSDREDSEEFLRRRRLTPIPTYAKKEINRIRNSIASRLPDVIRRGGSKAWREAVHGKGKGIDNRGSSMNSFIAKTILAEMLVMRRVGVLVDAPRVDARTAAGVPENFRPWLNPFSVEHFRFLEAPPESTSDYEAVALRTFRNVFNPETRTAKQVNEIHQYWMEDGRAIYQRMGIDGTTEDGPIIDLGLDAIPFVLFDNEESLIKDASSYQITSLNIFSSDTNYAIDANFPILRRQRSALDDSYLDKDAGAEIGRLKGMWYEEGLDAPSWASPPTEPIQTSMELRQKMKEEVREIIIGSLTELADDGSMETALAYIGGNVQTGETRCWDHFQAIETANPERRKPIVVSYPENYSLKTDKERLEEANEFLDLGLKLVGQDAKKEASKEALDRLWKGRKSLEDIQKLKDQVDQAPYSVSDAKIVTDAVREGMVSPTTGAISLGYNEDEGQKAEEAAERKAARARIMTQDAMSSVGDPDQNADRNAVRDARDLQSRNSDGPGTRGEQVGGEDCIDEDGDGICPE